MTRFSLISAIVLMGALAACEGPQRYPLSQQPCGPSDPVLDMQPPVCPPLTP